MILMILAIAAWAAPGTDSHTWPAGLKALELENSAGDVTVTTGGDKMKADWTIRRDTGCLHTVTTQGDRAVVRFEQARNRSDCEADFRLTVPPGTRVEVELGAGDLRLSGPLGETTAAVGAGDLTVDGLAGLTADVGAGGISGSLAGPIELAVGAGSVHLSGLAHPAEVSVGTGGVDLTWARAPTGTVDVSAGVGGIDIRFPAGTTIRSRLGEHARVSVPVDDGSPTVVRAAAGLGGVSVR